MFLNSREVRLPKPCFSQGSLRLHGPVGLCQAWGTPRFAAHVVQREQRKMGSYSKPRLWPLDLLRGLAPRLESTNCMGLTQGF